MLFSVYFVFFFFFFQAEDGIRDTSVTGVQTCALPICHLVRRHRGDIAILEREPARARRVESGDDVEDRGLAGAVRSEERRVGKECRSRGWRYHWKEKENETRHESTADVIG